MKKILLSKLFMLTLITPLFLISSCSKKEGCTDPAAINYDQDAEEDDGSCEYEENNNGNDNGDSGEPVVLSGTIDSPLLLEDIFEPSELVDYIIQGSLTINAAVTVEPGVRFLMKPGARVFVRSGGSLDMTGTEQDTIFMTGEQDVHGYWDYILFDGSNNPNNKMIYTSVHNGGGSNTRDAMISLGGNSRVTFMNSTFSKSERFGIRLNSEDGNIPDFKDNNVKNCNLHPVSLDNFSQAINFDESSDFTQGNANNSVRIGSRTIQQSFTIPKLSGPYEAHGRIRFNGEVVVEAGTTIKMAASARITVESNASLKCIGTSSERITIEGTQPVEGFFECIRFNNSNNTNNEFQYVDVSYGGGSNIYPATIFLSSASRFKMGNSSINFSARNGISGSNSAIYEDDGNNTFNGNVLDDIDL